MTKSVPAKTLAKRSTAARAGRAHRQRTPRTKVAPAQRPFGQADARRVFRAIEQLEEAQRRVSARGADLLALAGDIGQAAVSLERQRLVGSLAERMLLRDLLALRDWFARTPKNQWPEGLPAFELLPDAMMNWLADRFRLEPDLAANQELEVPASALDNFDCDAEPVVGDNALVRIRVVHPGWKCGRQVFVRPRVSILNPGLQAASA